MDRDVFVPENHIRRRYERALRRRYWAGAGDVVCKYNSMYVRIYAFSIYLTYAADVMPSLSLGRETKGRCEEYLATALDQLNIFFSLSAARERDYADWLFVQDCSRILCSR